MKEYEAEDFLLISGIQHFIYCRRQWALIHIEKAWADNFFTMDGQLKHERADDKSERIKRKDVIELRALPISSNRLGICGQCDVVELKRSSEGVFLPKYQEFFEVYPIEYKRGKPKLEDSDKLQLLAEAVCLEEMMMTVIPRGALFYFETRRREEIEFTDGLRYKLDEIVLEMHKYFDENKTPKVKKGPKCKACSLKEPCLYEIGDSISVKEYIEGKFE